MADVAECGSEKDFGGNGTMNDRTGLCIPGIDCMKQRVWRFGTKRLGTVSGLYDACGLVIGMRLADRLASVAESGVLVETVGKTGDDMK